MSKPETIKIDDVEYIRSDAQSLIAERDAALREVAAYKQALADFEAYPLASTIYGDYVPGWINGRVAELLAANA